MATLSYIYKLIKCPSLLVTTEEKAKCTKWYDCLFAATFIFFRYPTSICIYSVTDTACLVAFIDIKIITC